MLILLCGAMLARSSDSYQQLMHVTEVCLRFVSFSLVELLKLNFFLEFEAEICHEFEAEFLSKLV